MKAEKKEQAMLYVAAGIQLVLCMLAVITGIGKWSSQKNKQRQKELKLQGKLERRQQKAAFRQELKKNKIQWKAELRQEKKRRKAAQLLGLEEA